MCGICGIVSKTNVLGTMESALNGMTDALHHRGPDGEGRYADYGVSIAMRRLSIIDVQGGSQPLYSEDKGLVLIANGEIYNFVELRHELEAKGHVFRTRSDCETILHLYEEKGVDCVKSLRGMFAFALWDVKRRRLMLARDRMGEKPLYLCEQAGRLIFASEMKAILRSGLLPFELDPKSVDLYFHYQYVPEPKTILKGVRKLNAAHWMTIDVDSWRVEEKCYWKMEDAPPLYGNPGELIRGELDTVSEFVVRADVPVGVALSGGLDSGLIAALAAKRYPGQLHAFTVGYPGRPECDERDAAKELASYLKIPCHEVELRTEDVVESFPLINALRDDPIADISGHGYYHVAKAARDQGVPVLLQGQGGDELFWGYPWVREAAAETARKKACKETAFGILKYLRCSLPKGSARWQFRQWLEDLCGICSNLRMWGRHRRGKLDNFCFYDTIPAFSWICSHRQEFYGSDMADVLADRDTADSLFTFPHPWPDVDVRMTHLICDTYLRENGVSQGDRLSMASSVEMRLPLLDYRLVETVVGLRKTQSDSGLPPKQWLKDAAKGILPEFVLKRPKRGFTPPAEWYQGLLSCYGANIKDGSLVQQGILNPQAAYLLAAGGPGAHLVFPLWFRAVVLEEWVRAMTQSLP